MKRVLLIVALLLSGCDTRPDMQERFGGKSVVLVDGQGREYVVSHYVGNNYTVSPLESLK